MSRPEPKLSARELSDLYEDCIKLSAQGVRRDEAGCYRCGIRLQLTRECGGVLTL